MSKFLGPIHFWLHSKITLQETIEVSALEDLAEKGYNLEGLNQWDEKYGQPNPNELLENAINQDNIHGWLQQRIGFAETRFAGKVTTLKAQNNEALLTDVAAVFADYGRAIATQILEEGSWDQTLAGAHKLLHNQILEGMPCDHAGATTLNEENLFQWKSDRCLHQGYWLAVDGSPEDHYQLRDAFSGGFMKALGNINYQRVSQNGVTHYQLTRA